MQSTARAKPARSLTLTLDVRQSERLGSDGVRRRRREEVHFRRPPQLTASEAAPNRESLSSKVRPRHCELEIVSVESCPKRIMPGQPNQSSRPGAAAALRIEGEPRLEWKSRRRFDGISQGRRCEAATESGSVVSLIDGRKIDPNADARMKNEVFEVRCLGSSSGVCI